MVTVKKINSKKDLKQFMEFPLKLYKDNPFYVPDILSSQVEDYQEKKNPAFEYCDAQCFLAYRDNKIVGRISGIHNRKANEKFGKNYLTISMIDFIDDDEVVDALFDAVEQWGREHGCTHSHGPLGFSDMDREGMLVEGFDRLSLFITYYNHPYYITQMERRGYVKETDWIECRIEIPQEPVPRLVRISDEIIKRRNLHIVDLKTREKSIKETAEDMFKLWNETYFALFGVVPMNERQIEKYCSEFKPLINDKTTVFVYNSKDEMVAFGIASPSLEQAQRKSKGKMVPFGWIELLKALKSKHNDTLDLLLIAVKPELQGSGLNAVIMNEMHKKAIKAGFKYAETGPMLENNEKVQAQWKLFNLEQHKRRRCWVKEL